MRVPTSSAMSWGARRSDEMVGRVKRILRSETTIALAGGLIVMLAIIRAAGG
jgi:hypothetical protein